MHDGGIFFQQESVGREIFVPVDHYSYDLPPADDKLKQLIISHPVRPTQPPIGSCLQPITIVIANKCPRALIRMAIDDRLRKIIIQFPLIASPTLADPANRFPSS